MSPGDGKRRMSLQEPDDDDDSAFAEEDGKPSSSTQNRKAQNRIAQREFRQRKQHYIRDLEARVEVLSGDKEERVELMVLLIRNLLQENKELRDMVKSMASFLGEGLGSCLPRLGLSSAQLDAVLNKADTDTAYDAFINLKASRELEGKHPGIMFGRVRRRESKATNGQKRKRTESVDQHETSQSNEGQPPSNGGNSVDPPSSSSLVDFNQQSQQQQENMANQANSGGGANQNQQNGELMDQYSYLFPDLDAFANNTAQPSAAGPGPSTMMSMQGTNNPNMAYPNNAISPFSMGNPYWFGGPMYATPQEIPSVPSWNLNFPSAFPMMTQNLASNHLNNPNGQAMTPNFPPTPAEQTHTGNNILPDPKCQNMLGRYHPSFGFGVSVKSPAVKVENSNQNSNSNTPDASAGGGSGTLREGNFTSDRHPPDMLAAKEKQRKLREAVASITKDTALDVTDLPMEEVAKRERRMREFERIIMENGNGDESTPAAWHNVSRELNQYRVDHNHVLPPALRPTMVQRLIPHEYVIDGIPFSSMRDRMILLKGQYDIVTVFTDLLSAMHMRGGDGLNYEDWELDESWLVKFNMLVDEGVYEVTNKWRATRGEPPLVRPTTSADAHIEEMLSGSRKAA